MKAVQPKGFFTKRLRLTVTKPVSVNGKGYGKQNNKF